VGDVFLERSTFSETAFDELSIIWDERGYGNTADIYYEKLCTVIMYYNIMLIIKLKYEQKDYEM
jgi:hypothetical protein